MSIRTWITGALAGIFLVLLVHAAYVSEQTSNLPQLFAFAALFLGFNLDYATGRIIEELGKRSPDAQQTD